MNTILDAKIKLKSLPYKKYLNLSIFIFLTFAILKMDFQTLIIVSIFHPKEYMSCTCSVVTSSSKILVI